MTSFNECRFCGGTGCLACQKERERAKRESAWAAAPHDDRSQSNVSKPKVVRIRSAGLVCACNRCGCPVKVAAKRRSDAEILRLSETNKGVCANCAVTEFLYNTYPANSIIDGRGPEMLLHPGVGEAFLQSGLMDRADMDIREVNWKAVVDNWNLPVKVSKSPRNPYRMGDAKRQKDDMEQHKQHCGDAREGIKQALSEQFGGEFDVEMRGGDVIARKKDGKS